MAHAETKMVALDAVSQTCLKAAHKFELELRIGLYAADTGSTTRCGKPDGDVMVAS